jgi:predicted nucleic acid-binding protein
VKYTIDASVWVAAVQSAEPASVASMQAIASAAISGIVCPTLVYAEVAGALGRVMSERAGLETAKALAGIAELLPVTMDIAGRAGAIAASARIRGANAVYLAVADSQKAILITLDKEQLARAPSRLKAMTPADFLAGLDVQR